MIYFVSNQARWQSSFPEATMAEVVEFCRNAGKIAVDTETTGLDYINGHIIMCQVGNAEHQYVIDARNVDLSPLKDILEDDTIRKYLQNVKFDYNFFRSAGITLENTVDTMLQEQILTNGKKWEGFGLDDLVQQYMGVTMDKTTRSEFCTLGNREFTDTQIRYGAMDVQYLISISDKQEHEAERLNLKRIFQLENRAALAIADISFNGIAINRDKWLALAEKSTSATSVMESELDNMILKTPELNEKFRLKEIQQDLFIPVEQLRHVGIKWSSPAQSLKVLQELVPKLESVNANELEPYRGDFPIIDKYISYKEAAKLSTSYGREFLKNVASDGRIHTKFRQLLVTGRLSSSEPNMQQIPSDNIYRNCFEPGYQDWVFVSGDYSSQELALIAFGSRDPVWMNALRQGQDLHSVCAELVYAKEWKKAAEPGCAYYANNAKAKCDCKEHKSLRQSVKTINFGLAYGMTEVKLSSRLQIDVKEAGKLIRRYFKVFPAIHDYLESLAMFGKFNGYIRTLFPWGRIRFFPQWEPKLTDFNVLGSIERESKNTPIQGAGADMVKYALVTIRKYIKDNNLPVKIVMQVHDQIDTICPKDFAPEWRNMLQDLMEKAARLTIPNGLLKADVKISLTWEK